MPNSTTYGPEHGLYDLSNEGDFNAQFQALQMRKYQQQWEAKILTQNKRHYYPRLRLPLPNSQLQDTSMNTLGLLAALASESGSHKPSSEDHQGHNTQVSYVGGANDFDAASSDQNSGNVSNILPNSVSITRQPALHR